MTVADELDYTNPIVARVMDGVRTYIARSSHRNEDQIEKADTALAGVTAEILKREKKQFACIVTTDIDAGEGAVSALSSNGFKSRVQFCDGFDFIDDLTI